MSPIVSDVMYIKELELENFKSFRGRVKVPLKNGFTVVTGPNGSGKSNIVDAIIFCLGLSSSRTLRAEKLTDLIHNTTDKEPDYAQVRILLDNTMRELPINSDDVEIIRKVRRTDTGYYSYFYLNGKSVNLSDIHAQLSRVGVRPDGYNIVMQGDITQIVSMSPLERRRMIDEIAGIAEFDEKKARALAELDVVRDRIERVNVILEELEMQLARLKDERDLAVKYHHLREEKRKYEGYMLLSKLKDTEFQLMNINSMIAEGEKALTKKRENVEILQEKHQKLREQLVELNKEISDKGERKQLSLKIELEDLKGAVFRTESSLEGIERDREERNKNKRILLQKISELTEEVNRLEVEMGEEDTRLEHLQQELESVESERGLIQQQMEGENSKISTLTENVSKLRGELENLLNLKSNMVRRRDELMDTARRRSMEEHTLNERINEARGLILSADEDRAQIEAELHTIEEEIKTGREELKELDERHSRLEQKLSAVEEELHRAHVEYGKLEAKVQAMEESRYSKSVETVLKASKRGELYGIYGTVAQLGSVNKEFSTALEMAAGGRMQFIVVDNDEDASVGIAYLKKKNAGRVTFLPLNKLRRRKIPRAPKEEGVIDYAINLVEFKDKFEPAFQYALGETLVVDSLNNARRLIGKYRMVTLEGDVVEREGAMTGGSMRSKVSFGTVERKKLEELAENITILESKYRSTLTELKQTDKMLFTLRREIDELEMKFSGKEAEIQEVSTRKERLDREISGWEEEIKKIAVERLEIRDGLAEVEQKIEGCEKDIVEISEKVNDAEKKLEQSELTELRRKIESLDARINHLKERIRETMMKHRRLELDKKYSTEQIEENKMRINEMQQQEDDSKQKENELKETREELLKEIKKKEAEIEEVSIGLKEIIAKRDSLEDVIEESRDILADAKRELDEEEAKVSALIHSRETIDDEINELRKDLESSGIKPDSQEEVPSVKTVERRIASIERKMAELEPVNMRAVEDYKRTLARENELKTRRDTLQRERTEILKRINHYEKMKREVFMECFNSINESFMRIFSELSGGAGHLFLESPDEPLEGGLTIKARPSGKQLQRLEALSGGEKSLTALAFIIAIQEYEPAPFYVFDEVDMFLDGVNVEKVAQLINRSASNAQFIVVSLRKPMIETAEWTIGVAMRDKTISVITGIKLGN
ncbi:MAG: chromosome segregation protein SMC [Methermicoccaceae archaeon]